MTGDLAALLDHLQVGPVNALGWSDGGIEVLLLGVLHPEKVKKIAAMAANLDPSDQAIYPETIAMAKEWAASIPRDTPEGSRELKVTEMMLAEPHIDPKSLDAIEAPTLVMAGDLDLIRDRHTLEIYHRIPNAELAIFPHASHMFPYDEPELFNATVERFFRTPYVKEDRIQDVLTSFKKMRPEE